VFGDYQVVDGDIGQLNFEIERESGEIPQENLMNPNFRQKTTPFLVIAY
jgi:hypothetical protein